MMGNCSTTEFSIPLCSVSYSYKDKLLPTSDGKRPNSPSEPSHFSFKNQSRHANKPTVNVEGNIRDAFQGRCLPKRRTKLNNSSYYHLILWRWDLNNWKRNVLAASEGNTMRRKGGLNSAKQETKVFQFNESMDKLIN